MKPKIHVLRFGNFDLWTNVSNANTKIYEDKRDLYCIVPSSAKKKKKSKFSEILHNYINPFPPE